MPKTKLGTGDFGEEVARVHDSLAKHGIDVSPEERKRNFFGPTTREAIGKFQAEHGIDPTCEVCEKTAEKLDSGKNAVALSLCSESADVSAGPWGVPASAPPNQGGSSAATSSAPRSGNDKGRSADGWVGADRSES